MNKTITYIEKLGKQFKHHYIGYTTEQLEEIKARTQAILEQHTELNPWFDKIRKDVDEHHTTNRLIFHALW